MNKSDNQFIYRIMLILILWMVSACSFAQTEPTQPSSIPTLASVDIPETDWGTVELIAQAEHIPAPVFLESLNGTIFAWTGAQDGEARHFSRGYQGNSQIMALAAHFPQQQQLFPIDHGALMLWLDRTSTSLDSRLQVGTFSEQGIAIVGAVTVSDHGTRNYDAIALEDRQIRIVWSGGLGEVTNLYLHTVDHGGRPLGGEQIRIDADYPALIQDNNGIVHLFWLENNGRAAYHAQFEETATPQIINSRRIASNNLAGTDAIDNFTVGFDGTYAYLLWNIRRINGERRVLISTGQLADERFSTPIPLLTSDELPVQWATALSDIQNPLPIVVNQGDDLSLLWMQEGILQETEWITSSGQLIGAGYIGSDRNNLSVSWSAPTLNGYANLFYVSRRRNP